MSNTEVGAIQALATELSTHLKSTPKLDPHDVFEEHVAVLKGVILHHESAIREAQDEVDYHRKARSLRSNELITYLEAQNTVLRQKLAERESED
jgi:hypothetical protein